jgi:hypothetical protein
MPTSRNWRHQTARHCADLRRAARGQSSVVDEKSAIQALDRLDRCSRFPGQAERYVEYFRHGTLSLCRPRDQKRPGHRKHCEPPHQPGICPLSPRGRRHTASGKEIHLIVDNLSAHKTKIVDRFLADHPKVSLHYTPTYSSWLNQVEN